LARDVGNDRCAAGTGSAKAQAGDDLSKNWDLRAGIFTPERAVSRQKEGDVWFTIGAERVVYTSERYVGSFSVDYYGSGSLYSVPIQFNLQATTHNFRYGVGAGVGVSHDLTRGITNFAYNAGIGYSFPQGKNVINTDLHYHFLNGSGELNGWSFTVGGRF